MRTQISTNVSKRTRKQADELMTRHGYSLRDVISIAIDRLYREGMKYMSLGTHATEKQARDAARAHERQHHGGEETCSIEPISDSEGFGYRVICNHC